MTGSLEVSGDVASASAALSGLILVFFAAALSSFDGYDDGQKQAVRWTYRRRAWPAFGGFLASLCACALALYAKAVGSEAAAVWAIIALGVAGVSVLVSAFLSVLEIG
jgi:peptidoglycan/LPS O-acetylase OafA/YrhL